MSKWQNIAVENPILFYKCDKLLAAIIFLAAIILESKWPEQKSPDFFFGCTFTQKKNE